MMTGMISSVLPAIGKDWMLDKSQLGVLTSIGMLGMGVGAGFSGMFSDRHGRKNVMISTITLFSIATLLSGFAPNYALLVVLRFITGLGLGGYLPTASTLMSEFAPTKVRGLYGVLLESFWAWGWIFNALVAYLIIPTYGWRVAFFTGAIP